jgi:Methyltransferase domain
MAKSIEAASVLDYGCGKGTLAKSLPFPIWEYDPAIPGKEESPRPADFVVCLDVLEHIEPDRIEFVLADLRRCVKKTGYFVIHMGPSSKTLADGRNAHILQRDQAWWEKQIGRHFQIGKAIARGVLLDVIVVPKAVKGRVSAARVPMEMAAL